MPAVPTAREGGDTRPRSWGTVETGDSRGEVSCRHLWEYCLQCLRTWNWELIKGGEEAGTSLAAFGAGRAVCPGLLGPACPAQVGSGSARVRSWRSPGRRARAGRRTQAPVEATERSQIAVHPANQKQVYLHNSTLLCLHTVTPQPVGSPETQKCERIGRSWAFP